MDEDDPFEVAKIVYALYKIQEGSIEDIDDWARNLTPEDEVNILRLMRVLDGRDETT